MEQEEPKPVEEDEDSLTVVCVCAFLDSMTKRATDKEAYLADPDRKALLDQLCKQTGVHPTSVLAKHFFSFIDGVETGMAIANALLGEESKT